MFDEKSGVHEFDIIWKQSSFQVLLLRIANAEKLAASILSGTAMTIMCDLFTPPNDTVTTPSESP